MNGSTPDETMTAKLRQLAPLAETLRIEVLSWVATEVRLRLAWQARLCTVGGVVHGGTIMAFADTAGGMIAVMNLPEDADGTTTIESKTNFLRAVRSGHATAVARPLHVGKRLIVVETDVLDDSGELAARVTQSQAVL